MTCGIYKIENLINHKIYIGQSIEIERRLQKHKTIKDDLYIHRAIQKYGVKNFSFDIIQKCSQKQLDEKQIYWIQYYNSLIPNGYNMIPGGSNGAGLAKGKIVQKYSLQGQFIEQYPSANQAGIENNINGRNITSCCNGQRNQAGYFQWKWKDSEKEIQPIKGILIDDKVLQYSLNGEFIKQYNSVKQVCQVFKFSKSALSNACNGKIKTLLGFQWKYKNSNKEITKIQQFKKQDKPIKTSHGGINQFDKNLNFIAYYPTALQAKRQTGVNNANIGLCCQGKRKTAGGFIWKFADQN